MEKLELLKYKVRKYDEEKDKDLPTFSYSKLEVSEKCPMQYNIKYNQKQYAPQSAIALSLGTLCHKILELKARMLMERDKELTEMDYDYLFSVLRSGIEEKTEKGTEVIPGIEDIKKKFGFEIWYEPDNASGMNYEEKIDKFIKEVVPSRFDDTPEWKPFGAEMDFDFVYNYGTEEEPKEIHIHGFIDGVLVDDVENPTKFMVKDYKTSKKVYPDTQLKTSLQQSIYGLALYTMYGILPEDYEYDFILINERVKANSKGYLNRVCKKLDKLFNSIDEMNNTGKWNPKPTPLCFWCDYCSTNPDAVEPYKSMCEYFSLWSPQQKTFSVNKVWSEEDDNELNNDIPANNISNKPKRKLIF